MSAPASIPSTETPEQTRKRLRKVAAATIFGSMLEWYDFYLYATMAAIVFSKIFFDNSDPKTATLMAFSTFAIGFIARPFGGILFGYLGDKFGRKQVLVLTFCLMGVCTTLIGRSPATPRLASGRRSCWCLSALSRAWARAPSCRGRR